MRQHQNLLNDITNSCHGYFIDSTSLAKQANVMVFLFNTGWLIGPNKTDKAETIICHARYNESIYDKYFVHDYRYLVPVRHPVSWFQSALFYFANELHHIKENVSK